MLALAHALMPDPRVDIALIISDAANAPGLERAKALGLKTAIIERQEYATKAAHEEALLEQLAAAQIDLILLAGFMRLLSASFVSRYQDRILNIHPSLLPRHPGLHTHEAVLAHHDTHHGATVHVVTAVMDDGPILLQGRLCVQALDTADTLKNRVHQVEHLIYPQVVREWVSGKLAVRDGLVYVDAQPQQHPRILDFETL